MRAKRAKKLFRNDNDHEGNRSGLFFLLLALAISAISLFGFSVFYGSETAKEAVERESQLYEQSKNQQDQPVANNKDGQSNPEEEAKVSDSAQPSAVSTALVYFSKYSEDNNSTASASVERAVYQGQDPVAKVVEELIAGPSSAEKAEGYSGGFELKGDSNCNGQDFKVVTEENAIKLQFCRDYSNDGMAEEKLQREQIVKSLSGISGHPNVYILDKSGKCLFSHTLNGC